MPSSDYDRPVTEQPVDSTQPPNPSQLRTTWTGPVGIVLAMIFVVLMLSVVMG